MQDSDMHPYTTRHTQPTSHLLWVFDIYSVWDIYTKTHKCLTYTHHLICTVCTKDIFHFSLLKVSCVFYTAFKRLVIIIQWYGVHHTQNTHQHSCLPKDSDGQIWQHIYCRLSNVWSAEVVWWDMCCRTD